MITPSSPTEQLLFTTVRIEVEMDSGASGVGTGFFFGVKIDDRWVPLIVTNWHVVQNAKRGWFRLHEADTSGQQPKPSGRFFDVRLDNFERHWTRHPDPTVDLCAMPFQPVRQAAEDEIGKRIFNVTFVDSLVWIDEQLASLNAVEDVLMVGYPIGLWDEVNNLPLIRRGVTASHPALDFQGKPQFVIDAACFPGSSGSPVVLANIGSYYAKDGSLVVGTRFALLGVLYAGPQLTAQGEILIQPIPTSAVTRPPIMIHLGYVIKAKEVLTLARHIVQLAKSRGQL